MACLLATAKPADAQTPNAASSSPAGPLSFKVEKVSMRSLSATELILSLDVSVESRRSLALDEVSIDDLRLNGMPLYAQPMRKEVALAAGKSIDLSDPLQITVYLRDLASTAPIQQAIQSGQVALAGEAIAVVRLSGLARMAMMESRMTVATPIDSSIPFTLPGGDLARMAALALLRASDTGVKMLGASKGLASTLGLRPPDAPVPAIALLAATYNLADSAGNLQAETWTGVGVCLGGGWIATVREAVEPWEFDPRVKARLARKEASVAKKSYDLGAWAAGASILKPSIADSPGVEDSASSDSASRPIASVSSLASMGGQTLAKNQLEIAAVGAEASERIVDVDAQGHPAKEKIEARDARGNIALLRARGSELCATAVAAGATTTASPDAVTVFRFPLGLLGRTAAAEAVNMPVNLQQGRLSLAQQLDSSAYGSPILGANGLAGLVQDSDSGLEWPAVASGLALPDRIPGKKVEQKR